MRNIIKYISLATTLVCLLAGCNSFLDINPKSEVIDSDMFSTDEGCEDALYGIYAEMGSGKNLFGEALSYHLPEQLCGNIHSDLSDGYMIMAQRNWGIKAAADVAEVIWTDAYRVIGYINNAIQNLEASSENFRYMNLYKGEAYALRAFMHFELARYFTVSFASTDATLKARALPYVETYSYKVTPFSSRDEFYAKIISDLKKAEELLALDQQLIDVIRTKDANGFTSCRIIHMNLYAVQAMLARVYWTMNELENAAIYANKVISSKKFPLMAPSEFGNIDGGTLNLKETLFGFFSPKGNELYNKIHGSSTSKYKLVLNYETLYDNSNGGTDVRLMNWFDNQNQKCVKLLNPIYKLSDKPENVYNGNSIAGIPIISIAEMYYIVAEAKLTSAPSEAIAAIDNVLASRGITKFADLDNFGGLTADHIYRERVKEHFMDGQQFHNMKRLSKDVTAVGMLHRGNLDETFRIPIPKKIEDNIRQ